MRDLSRWDQGISPNLVPASSPRAVLSWPQQSAQPAPKGASERDLRIQSDKLIEATGLSSTPSQPEFLGQEVFDKPYIHFKYFQEYEKQVLQSTQNITVLERASQLGTLFKLVRHPNAQLTGSSGILETVLRGCSGIFNNSTDFFRYIETAW
jgi:hypothetical protein